MYVKIYARSKIALNVINAQWWMMASFYCARISILQANETPPSRNIIFYRIIIIIICTLHMYPAIAIKRWET